jgi:hypothetical protein
LQSASGVIGAEVGLPSVGYALTSTIRSVDEKIFTIGLHNSQTRDLGLSVEDRVRRHQSGVAIPKKAIHSVSFDVSRCNYVDGCIIAINCDNGSSEILVSKPKEVAKSLNEWLNGQLQDGPDTLNVNLAQIPVERIMAILVKQSRDQVLSEKEKDEIKSIPEFTERLYTEFLRYDENGQKCLIRGILRTWEKAGEFLKMRLRRGIMEKVFLVVVGSLICLGALTGVFLCIHYNVGLGTAIFWNGIVFLFGICVAGLTLPDLRKRLRLRAHLDAIPKN